MEAVLPTPISDRPLALLQGASGFAVLGVTAGVGVGGADDALRVAGVTLALALVPGLFTTPALIILHQSLRLETEPAALTAALLGALAEAGRLAGGLSVVVLFFALTSGLGRAAFVVALTWSGLTGLRAAGRRLRTVSGLRSPFRGVVRSAWLLLTGLVGLRLSWLLLAPAL